MASITPNQLKSLISTLAGQLHQDAKQKLGAAAPTLDEISATVGRLLGSGQVDMSNPGILSPALILQGISLLLPGPRVTEISSAVLGLLRTTCLFPGPVAPSAEWPESNMNQLTPPADGSKARVHFLYDIQSLPDVFDSDDNHLLSDGDKEKVFESAWQPWVKIPKSLLSVMDANQVAAGIVPNLTVRCVPVDGPANQLANATLGLPGTKLFDIQIDASEKWFHKKLQATLIHEVGHILGLDHSDDENDVMFDTLKGPPYTTKPSANDIAAFAAAGWVRKV